MVRCTQTIHRVLMTSCLSVLDHFVGLALKGLSNLLIYLIHLTTYTFVVRDIYVMQSNTTDKLPIFAVILIIFKVHL